VVRGVLLDRQRGALRPGDDLRGGALNADRTDGLAALVLDFGGPVLKTPFELLRSGERALGLAAGSFDWTGPFRPSADADWLLMQAGGITERDYWQRKADQFSRLTGRAATFHALMDALYDLPESQLIRAGARELVADARAAGLAVAVCTNDLRAFHSPEWVARLTILDSVDVLVDGSVEHVLKPDPAIYRMVTDRLGVPAQQCLFVDDQPANVAGARAVGMHTVTFDVTDPDASYRQTRSQLSTAKPSGPADQAASRR
jgi:putative hydrolase of the HAD superfamily